MDHLSQIAEFVWQNLLRIWPFLLFSVPFAVILRLSGLGERLRGAFMARPIVAVLLATAAGAFGPFCSCTVIPVIASMLIAGVPIAPVMSFWLASPTMDPEIFFLSVSVLGWNVAVARMVATLLVSLGGGLLTLWLINRGYLGKEVVRMGATKTPSARSFLRSTATWLKERWDSSQKQPSPVESGCGCTFSCFCESAGGCDSSRSSKRWGWKHVSQEILSASGRVAKFMLLAFVLEALIRFYVPQEWIIRSLSSGSLFAPALAALVGIPVYTGNLMAMPLIGGLLQQGMDPGAALAFLIAGPITTLPAMAAVWGVVNRRVFLLYFGLGLVGALLSGYGYRWASLFL